MASAVIKRFRINEIRNAEVFKENMVSLKVKGFTYVTSDYVIYCDKPAWEYSIYHFDNGSTIKVKFDGNLTIYGLEDQVDETIKSIENLAGKLIELNS